MATSVKRMLRNGKLYALPSSVRQPNSAAVRHWLENHEARKQFFRSFRQQHRLDVRKLARSYASKKSNPGRFPDAVVRVLRGDANHHVVAAETGIKTAALEDVLRRVTTDLYNLFGKDAASTPAAVLELLRENPGRLASIRRLKSAKRKAPKEPNPTVSQLRNRLRTAEDTVREQKEELDAAMEHIAQLSLQVASLNEQLEQARRGAAPNDAVVRSRSARQTADVPSNGTARASFAFMPQEGMDVDDAPGTSNNAVRATTGAANHIHRRIQHDLSGSFGGPTKYIYEATIADGTSNAGGLLTRMRPKTEPVVCKRFEMPTTTFQLDILVFEINVMRTHGRHPNIIGCSEVHYSETFVWAIMPCMDAGTVKNVVENANPSARRLPVRIAAFSIKQVLHAVEYLHSKDIVHRDLKSDNVFVDRWGAVKVGDFGWAARSRGRSTVGGTVDCMAPEVVCAWPGEATAQPYTEVVDVWSVGMLLYEVVRGQSPFLVDKQRTRLTQSNVDAELAEHNRQKEVRSEIMNTEALMNRMLNELRAISPDLCSFIGLLLKRNPAERLKAKQALKHAFLRYPDEAGWKDTVQRAMDKALNTDIGSFSAAYEEAKPKMRFHFRNADAAYTSYKQYCTQMKLLNQRAMTPREFLGEMKKMLSTAIATPDGVGYLKFAGNGSPWRAVLRHKQGKAMTQSSAYAYPPHVEVAEFEYVEQRSD